MPQKRSQHSHKPQGARSSGSSLSNGASNHGSTSRASSAYGGHAAHTAGKTSAVRSASSARIHRSSASSGGVGSGSIGIGSSVQGSPTVRSDGRLDEPLFNYETQGGTRAITRRQAILGAGTVGVLAVLGLGGSAVASSLSENSSDDFEVLRVSADDVYTTEDFEEVPGETTMTQLASFELPFGSQLWTSDSIVAACLVPGTTGSPLSCFQLLWLATGNLQTILGQAIGASEGYEIFSARATAKGLVWLEANIMDDTWRVYTAALSENGTPGDPVLVEESGHGWEMPMLAMVGPYAFWQVLPRTDSDYTYEDSKLKRVRAGADPEGVMTVWSSTGRMCCAPYATGNAIVIAPRVDTGGVYHQLTAIQADTLEILDTMIMPQSMRPIEIAWGETGFSFAFDAIYDYGDGISQLGTYTPASEHAGAASANSAGSRATDSNAADSTSSSATGASGASSSAADDASKNPSDEENGENAENEDETKVPAVIEGSEETEDSGGGTTNGGTEELEVDDKSKEPTGPEIPIDAEGEAGAAAETNVANNSANRSLLAHLGVQFAYADTAKNEDSDKDAKATGVTALDIAEDEDLAQNLRTETNTRTKNYGEKPWFRFPRTPNAAPAWCGPYFVVKSTTAIALIDLRRQSYSTLHVESGSDDYGDFLASSGTSKLLVTYANIDDNPLNGEARKCTLVRTWQPI